MLPFKSCEFCETTIPPGSTVCPHCGRPQKSGAEWSRYYRSVILAVVLSIAVMYLWSRFVGFR
jgi:RNA polymerase subunit RPABC4/transcription elongation factor Spt4